MQYFNEGNGLEAVKAFKASGSADALCMLGIIYEQGCGSVAANAMMAKNTSNKQPKKVVQKLKHISNYTLITN